MVHGTKGAMSIGPTALNRGRRLVSKKWKASRILPENTKKKKKLQVRC